MSTSIASTGLPDGKAIVVQMGARRNYAVPTALARAGRLEALYTDLTGTRGVGRIAGAFAAAPLPSGMRQAFGRLRNRIPPLEPKSLTQTFDWPALKYEITARKASTARMRVEARKTFNKEWSKQMLARGFGDATHVYAMMSGQTLEGDLFLQAAKEKGLEVVVDVTIALSTERIIEDQYKQYQGWGTPPETHLNATGQDNPAYPLTISLADKLICGSTFVAEDILANWQGDPSKVIVEPYTVHRSWLDLQACPLPGRVLFAGSADLRKGIHHFAAATQRLRAQGRNYEFRVVGNVESKVRLRPEVRDIEFCGRLARSQMVNEYSKADVLVLPTLSEGSAGVTYEALASGIPVVTTHAAGSQVVHGASGIIVPTEDPISLADAIQTIVENRDLRASLSRTGRNSMSKMAWDTYPSRLVSAVFA